MIPWKSLATAVADDGTTIELRQRGHEFLILAGGYDLMSSEDDASSRALAELGCAHIGAARAASVLVGGLGMGYTLRAALDATGPKARVHVAELVPAVVEWNRGVLADLAGRPLDDPRARLHVGDVRKLIRKGANFDAILLDVDNGPEALAHASNDQLLSPQGLERARAALAADGVLGVWSFSDDAQFTRRLQKHGWNAKAHRVTGSRKGRGRYHYIWIARPA